MNLSIPPELELGIPQKLLQIETTRLRLQAENKIRATEILIAMLRNVENSQVSAVTTKGKDSYGLI
jgi:hypothetical protein